MLRVDPSGVGDSEGDVPPLPLLEYYDTIEAGRCTTELRAVLQAARRRTGLEDWYVSGHCGAAIASVLAFAGERAVRGAALTDMPFFPAMRQPAVTQAKIASARSWIRAVTFEIQVPRVIRLLNFDRLPRRSPRLNRHSVLARDEHRCQYCGSRLPTCQLSLDHVIPRSRGGATTWDNVVCACLKCNVKKGGQTPQEARMRLRRRPFRPQRSPLLTVKLQDPKYEIWRTWIGGACWGADL